MTVADALRRLEMVKARQGADVQVYFDCPSCRQSFTPNTVAAVAMLTQTTPEPVGCPYHPEGYGQCADCCDIAADRAARKDTTT